MKVFNFSTRIEYMLAADEIYEDGKTYVHSADEKFLFELFHDSSDFTRAELVWEHCKDQTLVKSVLHVPDFKVITGDDARGFAYQCTDHVTLIEATDILRKSMSIDSALNLMRDLTSALNVIHVNLKLGHGQITSSNIKLMRPPANLSHRQNSWKWKPVFKNMSFSASDHSLLYESPENLVRRYRKQLNISHDETMKNDIWALGLVFYELLSGGRHYVSGRTIEDTHTRQNEDETWLLGAHEEELEQVLLYMFRMSFSFEIDKLPFKEIFGQTGNATSVSRVTEALVHLTGKRGPEDHQRALDLVNLVVNEMLEPDPEKRITTHQLYTRLTAMQSRSHGKTE
ncbi:hypothetical protein HDE_12917 [Halotydeus destructor]|nr:hypothetical protein HDE_12917 [Halotydeus destructor]